MTDEARLMRERDFHNRRFSGDDHARVQAQTGRFYKAVSNARSQYLCRLEQLSAGKTILEVGCAKGDVLRGLNGYLSATGIDISDAAVETGNSLNGSRPITLLVADAHRTGLDSQTFDLVFGSGIVHHLDTRLVVQEAARLLKPGGTALFIEPLGHNPLINYFRDRTPEARTADEHPLLSADLALFRENFRRVRIQYFGLTAIAAGFRRLEWTKPALQTLDRALLAIPGIRMQAWQALIEATGPEEN